MYYEDIFNDSNYDDSLGDMVKLVLQKCTEAMTEVSHPKSTRWAENNRTAKTCKVYSRKVNKIERIAD